MIGDTAPFYTRNVQNIFINNSQWTDVHGP